MHNSPQVNEKFASIFGYSMDKVLDKKIGTIGIGGHTEVVFVLCVVVCLPGCTRQMMRTGCARSKETHSKS